MLVASAVVGARCLGRDGSRVGPEKLLALARTSVDTRELPAWASAWAAATEIRSADGSEVPAPVG